MRFCAWLLGIVLLGIACMMLGALLVYSVVGCTAPPPCYDGHYLNITHYEVGPTVMTSGGIQVDDAKNELDVKAVDQMVLTTMACLRTRYPDGRLPVELQRAAHCLRPTFDTTLRSCMVIKVVPDWRVGCYAEDIFSCTVDPQLCSAKGLVPTADCPCSCRGAIQDNEVLLTTPQLTLLTADLVRLVTGCNDPWTEGLEECL